MYVGYGALELLLPHAHDLKAKRRIVHGLVQRIHARHRISVAETGRQDLMQRAEVGVAVVAKSAAEVERILEEVGRLAENGGAAVVLEWEPTVLEGDDPDTDDTTDDDEGNET